jgi:hypothetical protein
MMKLPAWYRTPTCQVVLVGITWSVKSRICTKLCSNFCIISFATPGMYQAVSNLGAGGTQNVTLSDTANGVHYGMFAISGLVSGGVCNRVYDQCTSLERTPTVSSSSSGTPTHFISWYSRICSLSRFSLVVKIQLSFLPSYAALPHIWPVFKHKARSGSLFSPVLFRASRQLSSGRLKAKS